MSAEIKNPSNVTYWIITDDIGYAEGLTGPEQTTTVGNGWRIHWVGSDHSEYVNQCNNLGLVPRDIDGTASVLTQPFRVSARQIRLWLVQNGFQLSQIDNAINSIEDLATREIVRIEWEFAPYVERSHPWLVPLAESLGLGESQIDQAFLEASVI
jgi:hypothetical protein